MSTENALLRDTVQLTAATGENILVDMLGALPAAGAAALGPVYMGGGAGEHVAVSVAGFAPCIAGGAIARGAALMATAEGKVVPHAGNAVQVGRAREAAAADGDEISVLLIPN